MKIQQFSYFNNVTLSSLDRQAIYASSFFNTGTPIIRGQIGFSMPITIADSTIYRCLLEENLKLKLNYDNKVETSDSIKVAYSMAHEVYRALYAEIDPQVLGLQNSFTSIVSKIDHIIEQLSFSDSFENTAEAGASIALVLTFLDDINPVLKDTIVGNIAFDDEFIARYRTNEKIVNTLLFNFTARQGLTVVIKEYLGMNIALSAHAQLYAAIQEGIAFALGVKIDGEEYVSYVLNSRKGGISEYNDGSFNSMDFPLACRSDGIYRIDQAPDDEVIASFKTGLMDFGSSVKKRVPNLYIGITNDERIIVKTITVDYGVKKEHQYEVRSYNNATDTTRADLGKGVKSRYWQFELSEIKDRVESLEVLFAMTTRRK